VPLTSVWAVVCRRCAAGGPHDARKRSILTCSSCTRHSRPTCGSIGSAARFATGSTPSRNVGATVHIVPAGHVSDVVFSRPRSTVAVLAPAVWLLAQATS
jgi:hypothetical protein